MKQQKTDIVKLESLTPEQEALIPIIRNEWLNLFYKDQEIDKVKAKEGIEWLYSFCKKDKPKVFFMDSPLGCQILASIGANIRDNIGANIGTNIRDNIWANYQKSSYYGNISDYGWVAFYKYFQSSNHFTEYDWSNFDKFAKLLQSGIYELYTFENVCIVCSKPKVYQDNANRLHNTSSHAVIFKDGFSQYYINGRFMPEWIFKGFTKEQFLKEENEDVRGGMYEIIESKGEGSMLTFLDAIEIDKQSFVHSNGEIEEMILYKTKESFNEEEDLNGKCPAQLAWLKMTCPSTGQTYLIPSDSSFDNCIDAAKYHRPDYVSKEIPYIWEQRN